MKKKLLFIMFTVGLIYAGYWYASLPGNNAMDKGGVVPVTVVSTYEKNISNRVEALGTAYANESINITANATETLAEIKFSDGQEVKRGDVIAVLEQSEEQAQLKAAQARLEENKRELQRLKTLIANKAAAKREYDERETMLNITQQEVKEIMARIEDRTLRAPFDGVLGLRRLSVGALVQPGNIITTIDDISQMKLDFNVPDIYLSKLFPGMEIESTSESLGDGIFSGKLETIDTRIDTETRSVLIRAIVPNPDKMIKPGILMKVTLFEDKRNALIVPEESIKQKGADHYVMLVNQADFKVEERKVETGIRQPGIVEIKSGLNSGDLVIVRGIDAVRPGQEVSVKEIWGQVREPGAAGNK